MKNGLSDKQFWIIVIIVCLLLLAGVSNVIITSIKMSNYLEDAVRWGREYVKLILSLVPIIIAFIIVMTCLWIEDR